MLEDASRFEDAITVAQQAAAFEEPVVRNHPARTEFAIGLAMIYSRLAMLSQIAAQPAMITVWRDRAAKTLRGILEREPNHSKAQRLLMDLPGTVENADAQE